MFMKILLLMLASEKSILPEIDAHKTIFQHCSTSILPGERQLPQRLGRPPRGRHPRLLQPDRPLDAQAQGGAGRHRQGRELLQPKDTEVKEDLQSLPQKQNATVLYLMENGCILLFIVDGSVWFYRGSHLGLAARQRGRKS